MVQPRAQAAQGAGLAPGVGKKYGIMEIEAERRYGYEWDGSYASKLLTYSERVGY